MDNFNVDKLIIRRINENDIKIFMKLRMAYIMETFENICESNEKEIENNLELYFNEHIDKNDFIGIIGEYNGKVVSVVYLIIKDFPPNPYMLNGRTGTLLNVYTFPEYRKKGIAKKIIKEILKEAKLMGINSIDLKSTDDGYTLYKNLGFVDDNKYKNMIIKL
jgi:GNAT superfamily N-acetyltransferase